MEELREKGFPVKRGRRVEIYSKDGKVLYASGKIWSVDGDTVFLAGGPSYRIDWPSVVYYDKSNNIILDTRKQ